MKILSITSYHLIIGALLLLCVTNACKKFVSIDPPATQTEQSNIFKSDQGALSALSGLYTTLQASSYLITNGGATLYPSLSADEIYGSYQNEQFDQFQTNSLLPSFEEGTKGRMWQPAYKAIYQANAILEGLNNPASDISAAVKKQIKGEALVVRSLLYFYLTNLFGDVPLIVSTNYIANQTEARTAGNKIYEQLMADLKEAMDLLPENYVSNGRVRPNKWAAAALLSRVYLYTASWREAETISTAVINSGKYIIDTDLNKVFVSSSTEAIWQLMQDESNTVEGRVFVPYAADAQPSYVIHDQLLNSFEANDKRKINWLGYSIVNGQNFYYPYKYKLRSLDTGAPTEYNMVLRVAEQWLIRAEAKAKQNNLAGAIEDLNIIRARAGVNPSIANTEAEVSAAISHERQTELFTEWGHRWLDLKRTNKATEALTALKTPNWQVTDVLYPIPQSEIQANPNLIQNPGY